MGEYAHIIRQRIPMEDMAQRAGLLVNRQGYAPCPFHREKTPSLKIYRGAGGWHCFGCGAHGSVIDFAMRYYGLSFAQALARLNGEFSLGLPLGRRPTARDIQATQRERLERERQRQAWQDAHAAALHEWQKAFDRWLSLERLRQAKAPKAPAEGFPGEYAYALHHLPEAKYLAQHAEDRLRAIEKEKGAWYERGA